MRLRARVCSKAKGDTRAKVDGRAKKATGLAIGATAAAQGEDGVGEVTLEVTSRFQDERFSQS